MSASDPNEPVRAGSLLSGRYQLIRIVAQGGMATVWQGHDNVLARAVAVKVLHAHLANDRLFLERFRREAISAARLAHPNVVATFDAGVAGDGTAFIVMELIRGRTLSAFSAQHRPLPVFVVIDITRQITDALAHAHSAGLVHRDIKPANVLVCDPQSEQEKAAPQVKVTDFGIAKAAEGLGLELTKTGMVLGTPKYLSPEQIDGREPDPRTDLYALGVVLFEMLTGETPFHGPSELAIAMQHMNAAPPHVRELRSGVSPALDALVATLLAKRPEDRPPSAVAVRQALAAIDPSEARPDPARSAVAAPSTRSATQPVTPIRADGGPPPRPPGSSTRVSPRPPAPGPAPRPPSGPGHRSASQAGYVRPPKRKPNWAGRMVAALVLAALVVAVVVLANGSGGNQPAAAPGSTVPSPPIAVQDISVFHVDRDADGAASVRNAIDGNPNTVWHTDVYATEAWGNLRRGLGLALTVGAKQTLHTLIVTSPTVGWSAEVYVADAIPNPPTLAPWGPPTDSKQSIDGSATFSLGGRKGSAILLWITDPSPARQAAVAELVVR